MKIQAEQLQEQIQTGKAVKLIDVRTPVEHEEVRLAGSHLMPLDRLDATAVKAMADEDHTCVLVCQGGKRAEQALQKLQAAGCTNLAILEGGVNAWLEAGLPVQRAHRRCLPLMRQVQLVIGLLALSGSVLALTIDVRFALLPALLGAGLTMAGVTGWCGLAILLAKMPWNHVPGQKASRSCSL